MMHRLMTPKRIGLLFALPLLAMQSCGGGGGDDAPPTPQGLGVLVKDGDTLPGDFQINTIESANMSNDQTISMIVSQPGDVNGVFVRSPDGNIREVLTAGSPLAQGLSMSVVRNMSMAQTGEFAFEVGDQLDNDGLFFWDGNQVHVVARTEPGTTPPGFRILSQLRVGAGGLIAFSDGTSPCTIDNSTGTGRLTCDLRIYSGQVGEVRQVTVPNDLTEQDPGRIIMEVNSRREIVVGLPSSGSDPLIGVIRNGQFDGLLNRRQQFPGLGAIFSARPRSISSNGAIALDASFDSDGDNNADRDRVLLLANGVLTPIAESGGTFQGNPEIDLEALGVDAANRVVYTVEFDAFATRQTSIRVWDGGQTHFVAHETMRFGGEDEEGNQLQIVEIEQIRFSQNGDVIFVATIGFFEDGTRTISETRLLRWNGGGLETVLRSGAEVRGGTLVGFSIADVNDSGDILLIGEVNRRANRALILLPR
jgi:hypothetical protein